MMRCLFDHKWGWPRKRGNKDIQVCLNCGAERESKVRFDGPRYHKTQDGVSNFAPTSLAITGIGRRLRTGEISSAAA